MADPIVTDITGTRKIVILSVVGVILGLVVVAQFIPEARAYTVDIVKTLLAFVPSIVK